MIAPTFFICIVLFTSAFGQTGPSCSNSNLLLTPTLRGEILDYLNDARNTLKNGQLLLENGEYALIPETMPALSWSCDLEEEMHQIGKGICDGTHFPSPTDYTWFWNTMGGAFHADVVYNGLHQFDLVGHYENYLSKHTIYAKSAINNIISVLHDKAENVACAIYDCSSHGGISFFYCKITPDVQFGDKIYEISSNVLVSYPFPSQDVICLEAYGVNIALRQLILEKINAIRQKIQEGTYLLENGNFALQAVNMPNLIWGCAEEAAVSWTTAFNFCQPTTDPETIFQTTIPHTWVNSNYFSQYPSEAGISDFLDQLFYNNPNFNFLSTSTAYPAPYPAAFALSDQATIIACAAVFCPGTGGTPSNFNLVCRAKPFTSNNQPLYQVV